MAGSTVIGATSESLSLRFLESSAARGIQKLDVAQGALVDAGTAGVEQFEKNARQEVLKLFAQEKLGEGELLFLVDENSKIVWHPKMAVGDSVSLANFAEWKNTLTGTFTLNVPGFVGPAVYRHFEPWKWSVVSATDQQLVRDPVVRFLRKVSVVILGILLVSILGMAYFLRRTVTIPLKSLSAIAMNTAQGKTDLVPYAGWGDELADLQNVFGRVCEANRKKANVASEIAQGRLQALVPVESDMDVLGKSMTTMLESLRNISAVKETSAVLLQEIEALSVELKPLARYSEDQRNSVQQVSSATEDLAQRFRETSHRAADASKISHDAKLRADAASERVKQIVSAMERVAASNAEIEKIAKIIDDIAFQTNLLALNASVEAAHAGKHGRGFAVVANEVRSLAQRSTDAVRNTNEKIADVIQAAYEGKIIIDEAVHVFGEICEGNAQISTLNDQVVALGEKAEVAVVETSTALNGVSQVSENSCAAVSRISDCLERLRVSAESMRSAMAAFD